MGGTLLEARRWQDGSSQPLLCAVCQLSKHRISSGQMPKKGSSEILPTNDILDKEHEQSVMCSPAQPEYHAQYSSPLVLTGVMRRFFFAARFAAIALSVNADAWLALLGFTQRCVNLRGYT
jgi:hypothetical protein